MQHVIILEDDPLFREEMGEFLASIGYKVTLTESISTFRKSFQPDLHEAAIIDWNLPDGEGTELCQELRRTGHSTGLVMLTGRTSTPEKVSGFQHGADYYLTKPVQFSELEVVLAALSRRLQTAAIARREKRWILNTITWELFPPSAKENAAPIQLSAQDLIVLRALMENHGRPVTRRQLVASLGKNYLDYDQRRMDTQMRRLRTKVQQECDLDLPIKTLHGIGYMFTAEAKICAK